MVKEVQGFQTSDGRFFEKREHADYAEALSNVEFLGKRAIQITQQNIMPFIEFIQDNPDAVIELCTTYKALLDTRIIDEGADILEELNEGEELDATDKK